VGAARGAAARGAVGRAGGADAVRLGGAHEGPPQAGLATPPSLLRPVPTHTSYRQFSFLFSR
jgi:hypothetical protein